jgi:hypothetical protein
VINAQCIRQEYRPGNQEFVVGLKSAEIGLSYDELLNKSHANA